MPLAAQGPYLERRQTLLDVLEPLGPPLQAVPATDDIDVARTWYDVLVKQGCEGIVVKHAISTYKPEHLWR
ncbi:hypothetical protein ABZ930_36930 [Streptomyces sp. NPDC046716]|uniref:ATP-dependent DNA ligase n=1 Tax=Streptomyces sp. NPDC046716 TaxID=3157093 RepID=UPI0033D7AE12